MLFVADIHVASFGADQLSLGTTEPPSSAIVLLMAAWTSGHERDGSGVSSPCSSSSFGPESFEDSQLSESTSRDREAGEDEGRTMPSERRYSKNAGGKGMRRALGVRDRYLTLMLAV